MKSVLIFICAIGAVVADSRYPQVRTPAGRILGSTLDSRLGKTIFAFRGVKFAEAPTGERRFQAPVPAADWRGVLNATTEGPGCPNIEEGFISEDCLRLNVYTTKLASNNSNEAAVKRPVLVFIHPGGLYALSGQSLNFGPQYLLDKNVVLVTINYRLGTLGFISTGDSSAPGNLGFKDQVAALRWIQRNIAAFGGDPDRVTISGYSAGGLSVIMHMLSPMSAGLFHRAISMSGSTLMNEPFPTEQTNLAQKQARLLDCPTEPNSAMIACLKTKPVENFTNTMEDFFEWRGSDPIIIWKPVVEPEVPGQERFLTAQPVSLIKQRKINQVPLIAGVTKDEFGGVVVDIDREYRNGNTTLLDDLNNNWDRIAPIISIYERDTCRSKYISDSLREFYFQDKPVGPSTYSGLAHLYADSVIIFPVYRTVQLFAQYMTKPVYFYRFSYQGRESYSMWNDTTPYGVVHMDDLQYLFYMSTIFPFSQLNDSEVKMLDLYSSMWVHFASTGYPVPNTVDFEDVAWIKYAAADDNYLDINLHPQMERGLYINRMQTWNRLFPVSRNHSQCRD